VNSKILFSYVVWTVLVAGPAFADEYSFVRIDVQCSATAAASDCPAGLTPGLVAAQTSAKGINARGDIVGFYVAGGIQHGFMLKDGEFSSLDFPVAGVRGTIANGINARGEVVGQYVLPVQLKDAKGVDLPEDSPLYCPANLPSPPNPSNTADPACIKGFRFWHGQFSTVTFPSTVDATGHEHKHPGAIAMHITSDGDIVGCVHDHDLAASMFGALWAKSGAVSLTPNGGQLSDSDAMAAAGVPMSMNNGATPGNNKHVAGFYMDMSSIQHGYLVNSGMFNSYDPDGANLTAIWDMNARQQFVGTFRFSGEALPKRHAFLQNPDGSPAVTLDFTCQDPDGCAGAPLGAVAFATIAFGVNSEGVIVGQYSLVSGGAAHGFVAMPADKK
jgi:hypothetical protein